jgi:restriction system protein
MSLWLIRTREKDEGRALAEGILMPGWEEIPTLLLTSKKNEIKALVRKATPDIDPDERSRLVWQLVGFRTKLLDDHTVIVPLQSGSVAVGRAVGEYRFDPDSGHVRRVRWLTRSLDAACLDPMTRHLAGLPLRAVKIGRKPDEQRVIQACKKASRGAPAAFGASLAMERKVTRSEAQDIIDARWGAFTLDGERALQFFDRKNGRSKRATN